MFTIAQYVFGVGRSNENSNNDDNNQTIENSPLQQSNIINEQQETSTSSPPSIGCYENDSESNCSLINIENDWILIDHVENGKTTKNKNHQHGRKVKSKLPITTIAATNLVDSNKNSTAIRHSNLKTFKNNNNKNEQWLVDPPECFKPIKRKNHQNEKLMDDNNDEKVEEMENLLIEHPSMSVFDNLFVKKPNPITKLATIVQQQSSCTIANSAIAVQQPLLSMNKAEQRKIILARIQQAQSKNNKENTNGNNNKKSKSNMANSLQTFNNNVPLAHLNGNNNKGLIIDN